jgi:pantoate--beta-alanine ligase
MKVVTSARDLPSGCAFVPTMGALHQGHASLFALAKKYSEEVIASIFVNPLQFENKEDLQNYPRTREADIEVAEAAGATLLWLPDEEEIYPPNYQKVTAGPVGDTFEGMSRPGHFDGVVTVVNRLFQLVKPRVAIFGEKDFQQLFLIKRIAEGVDIISAPTMRDANGLALSSRNARLSEEDRKASTVIYRALTESKSEAELKAILATEPRFILDYAEYIDEESFKPAEPHTQRVRAIVAGWINGVRLIDNMPMGARE